MFLLAALQAAGFVCLWGGGGGCLWVNVLSKQLLTSQTVSAARICSITFLFGKLLIPLFFKHIKDIKSTFKLIFPNYFCAKELHRSSRAEVLRSSLRLIRTA